MKEKIILRTVFLFIIILEIPFIGYLAASLLPQSTIRFSKIPAVRLFPENWAFFTNNPQHEDYLIYSFSENKNGKYTCLITPNFSFDNLFGINRKSRLQSKEIASAIPYIHDTAWIEIKGNLELNSHLMSGMQIIKIPTSSNYPYFKGKYILQRVTPIPWAGFNNFNQELRTSKIVVIEFQKAISKT